MLLVALAAGKMRFLVQPYVLKPNGNVFDEIRNFFIDGEWAYSVYTDGVDYEGFWEQPEGKLKEACKKLPGTKFYEILIDFMGFLFPMLCSCFLFIHFSSTSS